jgi:hypothetical protein
MVICVAGLIGAEYKGKVKSYKKGVVTVTVGDKDTEITVGKDAKVTDASGNEVKGKDRKEALKEGVSVDITTKKEGDKEVATEVKIKK